MAVFAYRCRRRTAATSDTQGRSHSNSHCKASELPSVELHLHVSFRQRQSGRAPVNHTPHSSAVRLPKRGHTEHGSICVPGPRPHLCTMQTHRNPSINPPHTPTDVGKHSPRISAIVIRNATTVYTSPRTTLLSHSARHITKKECAKNPQSPEPHRKAN